MATRIPTRATILRAKTQAAAGIPGACEWLAFIYRTGHGVRRDLKRAFAYNLQGAALGDVECMFAVGDMYDVGEGTRRNYQRARQFYEEAAALGHTDAMVSLGGCLWYGLGGARDGQRALRLYRRAARREDPHAHYNLALMYRHGDEVPRSIARARSHFSRAMAPGHPDAAGQLRRLAR